MYHIHYGGETRGPYLLEQIRNMWSSGTITADAVYWDEDNSAWEPLVGLVNLAQSGQELKQQPPERPAVPIPELRLMPPPLPRAEPPPLPVSLEKRRNRTRYAVIHGLLGFGIPLAAGGMMLQLIFSHENTAAFLGFAFVVFPGSLWFGYGVAARRWDAKAVERDPPKSSGCAVAFFTAIWLLAVVIIILVVNYGELRDTAPDASSNVRSPAPAALPNKPPATPAAGKTQARKEITPSSRGQIGGSKSEAEGQFDKGVSYDRKGDLSGAIGAYEKAVEIDPEYFQAWYALGVCHLKYKNADGAIAALSKASALVPTDANTQYELAVAYASNGSYGDANATLHRLENLDAQLETQLLRSFGLGVVQKFAVLDYPDLKVANSPLNHEFVSRFTAYRAQNAPLLNQNDWPIILAAESAAALASAAENARQAPVAPKTAQEVQAVNSTAVQMERKGDAFVVSAQLNGVIETRFIFDTGASYVFLPEDVFRRLWATGTISDAFSLPDVTMTVANGAKVQANRYIVRTIKVGESTASDVEVITHEGSEPLLGQSFLAKFKSWSVDNESAQLILTGSVPAAPIPLQTLEISQYITRPPLGTAMENQTQREERQLAAELNGMQKIETLGLYATAVRTVDESTVLADGSSEWLLEEGETFPFLGFIDDTARVRIGRTWFSVPRSAVKVVRLSENPELARKHQEMLRQARLRQ